MAAAVAAACVQAARSSPTLPTSPAATVSSNVAAGVVPANAAGDFQACLAEGGVEVAEIVLDGLGRPRLDLALIDVDMSDPANSAVVAACSPVLSSGALDLSDTPLLRSLVVERLSRFSACVRSRGVDGFPDPAPGFNGIGEPYPPGEIPYGDPDFESALTICWARAAAGTL